MLTDSIRRKLLFGLSLVSLILITLMMGGAYVLYSYSQVVDDLDQLLSDAPRREAMLQEVISLKGHLWTFKSENPRGWNGQSLATGQANMKDDLDGLKTATSEFRLRLDRLRETAPAEIVDVVSNNLFGIETDIRIIESVIEELPRGNTAEQAQRLRHLEAETERLLFHISNLHEPVGSLNLSVDKARQVYRTGRYVILIAFIASGILLVWLARCGYRWIFKPIRELYEGSSRVAQGDFDFRLHLDQQDEMGDLAKAFNKMTNRFQEIKTDLDRQVRDRVNQLVRSERLAGIGFLAAGVAHEINTPLTGISMVAESLMSRKDELLAQVPEEERADLLEDLEIVLNESRQCRSITKKLLEFARGEGDTRSRVDVTQVVNEVIHLVSHLGKYRTYKLVFDHQTPCRIEANRSELKQVILNLVANGMEAMDEGGTLTIELFEQTDQIELRISDEGAGMTPETLEHLFEPFFTHAKPGKGTGIGLAITHRIIVEHGGTIEPRSEGLGKGSTFHIHLPRKSASSRAA